MICFFFFFSQANKIENTQKSSTEDIKQINESIPLDDGSTNNNNVPEIHTHTHTVWCVYLSRLLFF